MAKFIFVYHGGKKPESAEEGAKFMAAWKAWFEGLGEAIVEPGNPVGMSKTVTSDGVEDNGGSNPISGYTVIQAESIEAACALCANSPHLNGGTIEVAELMNIEM